jgi:predicted kinase
MNIDRLPDNIEDPSHAADTTHLTEPSPPEAPPPAEPEHHPTLYQQPRRERDPESESGTAPRTDAPSDSPRQSSDKMQVSPESAEPRSRQEHADEPPPYESTGVTDAGAEDRNASTTAASADGVPDSGDAIGKASDDEIEIAFAIEDSTENPISDREPSQEDDTGETEKDTEKSPEQEDPPSSGAEDSRAAAEIAPNDDAPAEDDRILPLTDKEWAEHLTEVRDSLDKARTAGLTTDRLYTIDPDHKEWNSERNQLQSALVADLYRRAQEVPCNHQAIIAGGLGGAGKTTVLRDHAGIDPSQYLTINPDDIKEEMAHRGMVPNIDNLSPMEASDLAHEEASYIAKRLALRAMTDGKNIIWDITMSSQESTEKRINNLRDAAYSQIDGIFVDIPADVSVARTELRHREGHEQWRVNQGLGGRFVPSEVIHDQVDSEWGSGNRRTYEKVKDKLNNWSIYDNSKYGNTPELIDSSEQPRLGRVTERSP